MAVETGDLNYSEFNLKFELVLLRLSYCPLLVHRSKMGKLSGFFTFNLLCFENTVVEAALVLVSLK